MPLSAGQKLGPYEILSQIGAGGMGEVWKARDTRLDRIVAIKTSKTGFSERFEHEARAVAALNHPHICQLYDVAASPEGFGYLVMEYVAGAPLKGPLSLDQALKYSVQICAALDAAHTKGVTHRDLKPANILVTKQGVKLLDFGLAKIEKPITAPEETVTAGLTMKGQILGTLLYMSPEQINGQEADARSDIFSFGLVLYEMLTGKRAFDGKTAASVIAAILERPAPSIADIAPPTLDRVLKRCLEKDPENRWQNARDLRAELEWIGTTPQASRTEVPRQAAPTSKLPWIVATALTLALGALALVRFREQTPVAEPVRFEIPFPPNTSAPPLVPRAEVSPDGRKLAFSAVGADGLNQLWIRSLDSLEARPVPGAYLAETAEPFFWSWDGRFIAFLSAESKLKKVDVSGGSVQTLCDVAELLGGSWNREGVILIGGFQLPVMRISEAGGTPTPVTQLDAAHAELDHYFPQFLPDGRHFLYMRRGLTLGFYTGSIDAKPSEQSSKPLLQNAAIPEYYVPSANSNRGHLLFYREGRVMAQPFDPDKLQVSGDPVPIAEHVGSFAGLLGFFSASTNGVFAFTRGEFPGSRLIWLDRQGKVSGTLVEDAGIALDLTLSPDGKQAALARISPQGSDIWLYDVTGRRAPSRFTFDSIWPKSPVFSPDGSRIVFASDSNVSGGYLYEKLANGTKNAELVLRTDEPKSPSSWSPDGRFLLYMARAAKSKGDIWILPMEGNQKTPVLFQGTESNEGNAQFSPDGHWIAYDSDATGRSEVYVREFMLGPDGEPQSTPPHLVSSGGGISPRWRGDAKELFYVSGDLKTILSAEITTKPDFQFSATKLSVPAPLRMIARVPVFPAVTSDGQRFLVSVPVAQSNGPRQFTVVLNWPALLKK